MKNARWFILIFILFLSAATLFQNCAGFDSAMNGNGNGYGGYHVGDPDPTQSPPNSSLPSSEFDLTQSTPCADGSSIQASIVQEGSLYFLTRQNCADLNPRIAIDPGGVTVESDGLLYQGALYTPR